MVVDTPLGSGRGILTAIIIRKSVKAINCYILIA